MSEAAVTCDTRICTSIAHGQSAVQTRDAGSHSHIYMHAVLQAGDWPMSLSEEELEAVAAAAQEGDADAALTLGTHHAYAIAGDERSGCMPLPDAMLLP